MKSSAFLVALLACMLAVPAMADQATPSGDRFGRMTPRILNHVDDLLDDEVVLHSIDGPTVWESAPFDTSRFNKIGLRFSAAEESGWVTCRVCWQFSPDDDYLDGIPSVSTGVPIQINVPPGDPGSGSGFVRPDGVPDLYIQRPIYPVTAPSTDFTDVRGLQAIVRCSLSVVLWGDFGRIGDDPLVDPGEIEPVEATATLTDVKVLLRRE